ncbi:zinc ribbon domain-containing protein [Hoyosella subflava]|uniref:zinc ribbon domain-containing protein n=1 Tax=Hoyosella subflava TaxID=639313 RepID=UPI0013051FCF
MTRSAKGTVEEPGVNVKHKAGLNRSILAQGWTQIHTLIIYKADQAGARVIAVRPHGTSTTCHACGSTTPGQCESQALFRRLHSASRRACRSASASASSIASSSPPRTASRLCALKPIL